MNHSQWEPVRRVNRREWRQGRWGEREDAVVVEVPVALVYNGVSHVVMMATPVDLEDFALGFSLSEGILESPSQLLGIDITSHERGLELQLEITAEPFAALKARRRNLAGRTGCGLCGAESLEQAILPPGRVTADVTVEAHVLARVLESMLQGQVLRRQTGAVHGAAFCAPGGEVLLVREDVGRHNALDKVLGGLRRSGLESDGFLLVTSRASYEMVAKAASANVPLLAAASAATDLAIEHARTCGLTLVGHAQGGRFLVYTHPQRIPGR